VRELIVANRTRADLIFLSPVFLTRSHPNGRTLGRRGFAALAQLSEVPVIALGGMNARRARTLNGAYGWAAIDAWL
jgi:thiamine-phosphate pyrophosphorylase